MSDKKVFIPKSKYPRIVIVGVGFAGLYLAKSLKKKPFQVVLVDKNNFHQFQPLLYQVATSSLAPDAIVFPIRKIIRGYKNLIFRMAEVLEICDDKNLIQTDCGAISYDYLVLATGSTNNFYGMKDVEKHAMGLKSIRESLNLRSVLLQNLEKAIESNNDEDRKKYTTVVIVGGGPAGVEMAGALAEFKKYIFYGDYPELDKFSLTIHLIEAGKQLLSTLSDKSSADSFNVLKRLHVNIHTNIGVKAYDGNQAILSDGKIIDASTLIWTAGVKGKIPKGINKEVIVRGNRVEVNGYNIIKNKKNIFAIGDVAFMPTKEYPKGHPMVAPVAIQQAEHLADNICKSETEWKSFNYIDKGSLATIGKKSAVADFGKLHLKGLFGWIIWSTVHLFSISGFKNKLIVGITWMINYFTYDKGNRIIIRKYKSK